MQIYGKEYGFAFTVGAHAEIAAFCPGGDLSRLDELFADGNQANMSKHTVDLICALSRAREAQRSFEEPGYTPAPLTPEIVCSLDFATFAALQDEAMAAMRIDGKGTVEVEPEKKRPAAAVKEG